jgi:hypothetical protein
MAQAIHSFHGETLSLSRIDLQLVAISEVAHEILTSGRLARFRAAEFYQRFVQGLLSKIAVETHDAQRFGLAYVQSLGEHGDCLRIDIAVYPL